MLTTSSILGNNLGKKNNETDMREREGREEGDKRERERKNETKGKRKRETDEEIGVGER
jgi:hypothetical protein